MSLRLFSQVNGDGDLIEAWLNYYLRLGVDRFHLIVHGPQAENEKLLAIKDSYPITIEDTYDGPFPAPLDPDRPTYTEKKKRLDALLARHTEQWVMLVDSDEFVEFPYEDILVTIRNLELANANLMAAPLLQRLTADGSLENPPEIEDPFDVFPLCSLDLYRRMGIRAEIFKYPLFYCVSGAELLEEGNHYPPQGFEPRDSGILGVTHHFKFRRALSGRLEKRINSPHAWRFEALGYRDYLNSHDGRVPLDGAFPYSREELFRRRLLRQLPASKPGCEKSMTQLPVACPEVAPSALESKKKTVASRDGKSSALPMPTGKRAVFVLPKTTERGDLERGLVELLRRLPESLLPAHFVCFGHDLITAQIDEDQRVKVVVDCVKQPQSLWDWLRIIRDHKPDILLFDYGWIDAFPWQAPVASFLAGVRRRISIQHCIPPLPSPVPGKSPRHRLRRWFGRRARQVLKAKISARLIGHVFNKTICVNSAFRDALVKTYGVPARKTVVIFNGVSTSTFTPSKTNGATVRARFDIDPEEFLLVCVARLAETSGLDILIRAVSRVVRQGIRCKCIIIGDGPLKTPLMRLVSSLGLSFHVFFEGFQQDMRPYLQAGSAFILTSFLGGTPTSVLEAMACGLPCLIANVDGISEIVKDQVSGLLIPPASMEAAADAIVYLATNPDKHGEMAGAARETVVRNFDIEKRINDLKVVLLR